MDQPQEHRWVIDSIEEGAASIEVDGVTLFTVPLSMLPKGVRPGLVLRVRYDGALTGATSVVAIEIDEAATAKALARSAAQVKKGERQANDPGGNVSF